MTIKLQKSIFKRIKVATNQSLYDYDGRFYQVQYIMYNNVYTKLIFMTNNNPQYYATTTTTPTERQQKQKQKLKYTMPNSPNISLNRPKPWCSLSTVVVMSTHCQGSQIPVKEKIYLIPMNPFLGLQTVILVQ